MGRRRVKIVWVATVLSLVVGGAWVATARSSGFACGSDWTAATMPPIAGTGGLDDVAAFSSTDAWAVGSRYDPVDQEGHTLIEHHDGTSWTIVPSPDGPAAPQSLLDGVAVRASDDAWAVGSFTKANNLVRTLVEHWDGTGWSRVKSPNAGQPANGQLSAVAAVAADEAWAVGSFGVGGPSRTLIQHWDGIGMDRRPESQQGPVPERAHRRRRGRRRRCLGGRHVVHEGVRRPDPDPALGRGRLEPGAEPERRAAGGGELPGVRGGRLGR